VCDAISDVNALLLLEKQRKIGKKKNSGKKRNERWTTRVSDATPVVPLTVDTAVAAHTAEQQGLAHTDLRFLRKTRSSGTIHN